MMDMMDSPYSVVLFAWYPMTSDQVRRRSSSEIAARTGDSILQEQPHLKPL